MSLKGAGSGIVGSTLVGCCVSEKRDFFARGTAKIGMEKISRSTVKAGGNKIPLGSSSSGTSGLRPRFRPNTPSNPL
jgi:hypothetical protein